MKTNPTKNAKQLARKLIANLALLCLAAAGPISAHADYTPGTVKIVVVQSVDGGEDPGDVIEMSRVGWGGCGGGGQ